MIVDTRRVPGLRIPADQPISRSAEEISRTYLNYVGQIMVAVPQICGITSGRLPRVR